MRAVITLDDQDNEGKPGLGMTVFLENGWTPTSTAHQAANALIQHLESLSAIHEAGEVKWVEGSDAGWIKDPIVAIPDSQPTSIIDLSAAPMTQ